MRFIQKILLVSLFPLLSGAQSGSSPDYFPLSVGNWWKYSVLETGGGFWGNPTTLYKTDSLSVLDKKTISDTIVYTLEFTTTYDSLLTQKSGSDSVITTVFKDSIVKDTGWVKEKGNELIFSGLNLKLFGVGAGFAPFCYFGHALNIGDTIQDCYDSSVVAEGMKIQVKKDSVNTITLYPLKITIGTVQKYYADRLGMVYHYEMIYQFNDYSSVIRQLVDYMLQDSTPVEIFPVTARLGAEGVLAVTPNPFNHNTAIQFYLKESGRVALEITNAAGQLVKTMEGVYGVGWKSVLWNGKDEASQSLKAGIYFLKFKSHDSQITRKMTLVK